MPLQLRCLQPPTAVTVDAPARLHLGFLDPNGSLGRAFGSLGLVIDAHGTRVTARVAPRERIDGVTNDAERERIAQCLARLRAAYGPLRVAIDVLDAPRAHTGLGSGTQMALAVGAAFARLAGVNAGGAELATVLGRGGRSGIGILGFELGGLLLDGGPGNAGTSAGPDTSADADADADADANADPHPRKSSPRVPPLLSRQPFPDAWRVLLVSDHAREGLHGARERHALASLAPFPQRLAAHLCHLVLMRILPAAAERDFAPFAHGLTELQHTIGEYFASAQGGVFASPDVERVLRAVAAERIAGIGQTSWGPTGFAIVASERDAHRALAAARDAARALPHIECSVVAARNRGATISDASQTGDRSQTRAASDANAADELNAHLRHSDAA